MADNQIERRHRIEWPTVVALASFWVAFGAAIAFTGTWPAATRVVVLALLGCFYLSLQHEVIHGHPTPWAGANRAPVVIPLQILQPFERFRVTHMDHHASDLTNPLVDPESHYVAPEVWLRAGRFERLLLRANRTLAARLTIGPVWTAWRNMRSDVRELVRDRSGRVSWSIHVVAAVSVLVVVRGAGLPLWIYFLGFVYGGSALTALRSFVEHSAHADQPRSAVVRSNWFFGVLFLNNNLHFTHHALPGAAWYRLPQLTRDLRSAELVAHGAGYYSGYLAVARRYMFRPFCQPVNPLLAKIEA